MSGGSVTLHLRGCGTTSTGASRTLVLPVFVLASNMLAQRFRNNTYLGSKVALTPRRCPFLAAFSLCCYA